MIAITRSHTSKGVTVGPSSRGSMIPALCTLTSSLPCAERTSANMRSTDASSDTSPATNCAPSPSSAAVRSPASSSMSLITTDAPSRANSSAISRPRPDPAPVISATLFASRSAIKRTLCDEAGANEPRPPRGV